MDILSIGIMFLLGGGLIAYSLWPRTGESRGTLKRRLEGKRTADEAGEIREKAREKATSSIVRKATPMLSRLIMPVSDAEQNLLRMKLAQAGYRQKGAQTVFLGSKSAAAIVGMFGGLGVAAFMQFSGAWILGSGILGLALGFLAPGLWLGSAMSARKDKVKRGLPDVLDLMVVSVESGLALDASIKRVGEEMENVHPEISEEFRIATRETQMGVRRGDALENMATRVGLDELRSLVSVVSQAEKFGTSVAKALRSQGETLRTKRRQKAEEKAQQTSVKLMIPLVLFIFPAMFIVLGGPAAIRMFESL